jgi:CTP:molybdopterin cytidylyltransferase MocA
MTTRPAGLGTQKLAGVWAIILAAGFSSRMGRHKPLLPLGGFTLLERAARLFRSAGVENVLAVAGHRRGETRAEASRLGLACKENPTPEAGMFSSVLAGLRALPAEARAFFLLPVDIPLVRPGTVRALLAARNEAPEREPGVVYPVHGGERGHPPLIDAGLVPAILRHAARGGAGGLRPVLEAAPALDVPVGDPGILLDMDTPEAYARLAAMADSAGQDFS